MKWFLFFALISVGEASFANNQCPKALQDVNINVELKPIKYDYSKTSNEIKILRGEKNKNLLGLYGAEKEISIRPSLKGFSFNNGSCAAVTGLDVNLTIYPTIYIAKEAQLFECTKKRTEQHEETHHQFEMLAIKKSKSVVMQLSYDVFSDQMVNLSKEGYTNLMQYKTKDLMAKIKDFFEKETTHLHKSIDTEENYERESGYCSKMENFKIHKLLNG